jgi:protocatechuate 3,4-dioxygenase beta subunit
MYFPGDPLLPHDPILNAVRDPKARRLLISEFDLATTTPEWALSFRWDVVLGRGSAATPLEERP